ncbi:hypothetical protein PCAR4_830106 [Paraburkholderia caribensis]|nr:hypothetical protein PCAR4_830106 [Paraburkholderia caribensis]
MFALIRKLRGDQSHPYSIAHAGHCGPHDRRNYGQCGGISICVIYEAQENEAWMSAVAKASHIEKETGLRGRTIFVDPLFLPG